MAKNLRYQGAGSSHINPTKLPQPLGFLPGAIYAPGAESDYKADMTTLKSLAMSGVACYVFDFYGWTSRSTGPQGVHWFGLRGYEPSLPCGQLHGRGDGGDRRRDPQQ